MTTPLKYARPVAYCGALRAASLFGLGVVTGHVAKHRHAAATVSRD